jgi:octaprenyl-diphosphate synthase
LIYRDTVLTPRAAPFLARPDEKPLPIRENPKLYMDLARRSKSNCGLFTRPLLPESGPSPGRTRRVNTKAPAYNPALLTVTSPFIVSVPQPAPQNQPLSVIAADMQAVDAAIRAQLHSDVPLVSQIADYIISAGGKRIRPALLLLMANAWGYRGDAHFKLAAVIEFIHTATLLHDDVVDESDLRRGRQTANALFGNAASVLVGDFVYSRAFQMMVSVQNMRVMQILADATNVIAEGEVLQLMNMHDPEVTEARYLQVIRSKTAKLFEAATELGSLLAGASEEQIAASAEYGRSLGTAFQLIDDVLDYSGKQSDIGKNVGDDLREGKPTLPLIYLMQHGSDKERELVRQCISQGDEAHFDEILSAITSSGALEYTRRQAENAAQRARDSIRGLPEGHYKEALLALASFAVERNH